MQSGEWDPQTPNEPLNPPPISGAWEPTGAALSDILPAPYIPPAGATAPQVTPGALAEPAEPSRLARGAALDLLSRLKATLVTLSLVALGVFAALAAFHATGVTARAASSSSQGATGGQGPQASPTTQSDDGGFFNQGPNGFGIGQPGSQGPAAGTTVS